MLNLPETTPDTPSSTASRGCGGASCESASCDADTPMRLPCRTPCRLVLASPNTLSLLGLQQILGQLGGVQLCAVVSERAELIEVWQRLGQIDVLIAEPDLLQDVYGLPALPQTRLLLLSHRAHAGQLPEGLKPCGFLSEHSTLEQVRGVLGQVIGCEEVVQARACACCPLISSLRATQPLPLSERECEVFALIGQGYGTNAIAETLGRSIKTIESHRHHIKLKLKLDDAPQLIDAAHRWVRGERI